MKTKRKNIAGGTLVSRALLDGLREMRNGGYHLEYTAEIEFWEDQIRAIVKDQRRAPRDVPELDSSTLVALDEAFPQPEKRRWQMADFVDGFRRSFALRMIRAGCEAMLQDPDQRQFGFCPVFSVKMRHLTSEERRIEEMFHEL